MNNEQLSTRRLPDGTMVAELSGELDLGSAPALRDLLSTQVTATRPPRVLVDLGLVTFMDSTALSALVGVRRAADTVGAGLQVVNPSPFVVRLLRITGLTESLGCQPVG